MEQDSYLISIGYREVKEGSLDSLESESTSIFGLGPSLAIFEFGKMAKLEHFEKKSLLKGGQ